MTTTHCRYLFEQNQKQTLDGKGDSLTVNVLCTGTTSRTTAAAAIALHLATIPPTLTLALKSIDTEAIAKAAYIGRAEYGVDEPLDVGEWSFSFDTTGGTVHKSVSYATRKYAAGGVTLPDFKNAIAVDRDRRVAGCDVPSPSLKFTITYRQPRSVITLAYIKALRALVGKVNSGTFAGFDAYEVMFLGASGKQGSKTDPSIDYHFIASENATNLQFGSITVALKRGHEYIWPWFGDKVDAQQLVVQPVGLYVEEVARAADFSTAQLTNLAA